MLLLPRILESTTPRVTTKSSLMAKFGRIRFDDLDWSQRRYRSRQAYAQSKLANMLMGMRLAELAVGAGIPLLSTLAHTGFTHIDMKTADGDLGPHASRDGQPRRWTRIPPMDVTQGTEALIFAAADRAAEQGAYYGAGGFGGLAGPTRRVRLPRSARRDPSLPASLWTVAEQLTETKLAL